MTENIFMEVSDTDVIGNSDVRGGKTFEIQAIVEIENKPPLQQKSTGASAQSELPSDEGDELEKLYESRKTAVSQPEESPPPPADVSCRPPAPLYVRRAGLRFWCTKRILDWQRQALRAREDPEAVLKPVQEYGEESASKNSEIGEAKHGHYENEGEHGHYENEGEHGHYENEGEHGHYENEGEHGHYENEEEHGHYEEHKYYQYDKNHAHDENDKEHAHYENDEEHSNLSTHVHADLDPDFLAAQDAIKNATAQPFYEMDITPADEEQEQPFYKMDVTAAKDKQQKEQPFYEINVASTDDNNEEVFYKMDGDKLGHPTRSENAYDDLDPDFVAAQDSVDRRHGTKEPSRGDDGTSCSQSCPAFCRFRLGRMVALCVGVIIVGIAATMVAVILNQHSVLRVHPNIVVDWWGEWTLYVRAYFQQNRDTAAGLEERYPGNEVVMVLLEDRFFWPFVCRYWKIYDDLPHTLDKAVSFGIGYGITRDEGVEAIAETFPHLKELQVLNIAKNSITNVGGRAVANRLVHLQQLRKLYLGENELALSVSALAKALANMTRLEYVSMAPITCYCNSTSLRMAAQQVRDAVHTLAGQLTDRRGFRLYDGSRNKDSMQGRHEVFSSMLNALETLRNKTDGLSKNGNAKLLLVRQVLLDTDVEALVKLFPYLKGIAELYIIKSRLSADAATVLAGQLHVLDTLKDLVLMYNTIGDEGVEAIAETFPHLKELQVLNIAKNSITNVGGKAVANRLVHLQQLRKLYLGENELALSVSALAKAFANMTRLEYVSMAPITCYCNSTSLRMAAQQVRDAVHTLAGQLTDRRGFRLYDGSRNKDSMQTAWQPVESKLTSGLGVTISNRQLKVKIKLLVRG
ncbi:PREDICTED: uncharacterized protein LOC109476006 [Branchiostoma belcheri]|uniref:Uncharacterized protein LOC109476006 n=1 Tax=Branchiostoma belcheri TaxID=7741 RepID=A0A6P4ZRW8_BRABE|nr:PREDICTED: uncharacterized protein LOC109476006 [Branchiostoma belcheri]